MASNEHDRLIPLSSQNDFEVADGEPDIRGWQVIAADGRGVGRVHDLLVDPDAMKVRYLEVDLDESTVGGRDERHTLVPIGHVDLDRTAGTVRVGGRPSADYGAVPAHRRDARPAGFGQRVDDAWSAHPVPPRPAAGTGTGAGRPSREREDEERLTLAEERLAVGRREREVGAVEVDKRVETRHVREEVPLAHEEVTVERRPIRDGQAAAGARIGEEGEIRVPLHAEEAVVERRVVPVEELVVRRRTVVENEVVEADLRRERADVRGDGVDGRPGEARDRR